tara:strand:+ start:311 stop:1705 length:1395 start_codon:yes stop_codon:yes gene_type:complete
MEQKFDVAIIGSGPGGYVAAIKAAQLGLSVAIIEKEDVGGVCLNWGCIPTKTLLRSAEIIDLVKKSSDFGIDILEYNLNLQKIIDRSKKIALKLSNGVKFLLSKNKVKLIHGNAKFIDKNRLLIQKPDAEENIYSSNIIIATGAKPKEIPGLKVDGNIVWNYRNALRAKKIPNKLIIVGSGAIGMEFASFYNSLGTEVSVLEMQDRILPVEDLEVSQFAKKQFESKGINFFLNSNFKVLEKCENRILINVESNNKKINLSAPHILVAIGVNGCTEGLGLDKVGVNVKSNSIPINKYCQTNVKGIYAIGDVTTSPCLAHKASYQGNIVAETISGKDVTKFLKVENIPGCTYSNPQIASIGLTEENAIKLGYELSIGNFPFIGNGKALAMGEEEGFVKTIFDKKTGELLGAHMVGAEVTELLSTYIVGKGLETTPDDFTSNIFPHPTMSEMLHESVLSSQNIAIHF